MIPSSETISTIFSDQKIFTIPVFQRTYEWDIDLWEGYWTTLMRKYESNDEDHLEFMGMVVIKDVSLDQNPKFWVIDGQQRLATTFLVLSALKSIYCDDINLSLKINSILFVHNPDGSCKFLPKFELSEKNFSEFSAILKNLPCFFISKIVRCHNFFYEKFEEKKFILDPQKLLDSIIYGLQFILLKLGISDNAGYIFETINLTGIHLEPIDTIRNNILGKFEDIDKMNSLYKTFWKDIEAEFNNIGDFPLFIRYFLLKDPDMLKNGFFKPDQLTQAIMDRLSIELKADSLYEDIEKFLAQMKLYARYYRIITNPAQLPTIDKELKKPLQKLKFLRGTQYMPFVLKCFGYYKDNKSIPIDILIEILKSIETYYVRRSVCGLNFINTEKIFFDLCSSISTQAALSILNTLQTEIVKELPSDGTFEKNFQKSDFYKTSDYNRFTQFILLSIEESKGGMSANFNPEEKFTIEHIMPQKLTNEWISHLGRFVKDSDYYVHTIGNLTLVTSQVNRFLFNNNCTFKFEVFGNTGFCLNNELARKTQWKISDIEERAEDFTKIALNLWPGVSGIEFRPLEKNTQLISLTVKGETFEINKIASLIELTIIGILKDKQWSVDILVEKDSNNELSLIESQFKLSQTIDCGEYGIIYCKKFSKLENSYKFCRRLIECIGWEPNRDWYGVARQKKIKFKFA